MTDPLVNGAYPLLEGVTPSWADVVVTMTATGVAALTTEDIAGVSTGRAISIGAQKRGSAKRRRTTGEETPSASLNLYHDGYNIFLEMLANSKGVYKRGDIYVVGLVVFGIEFKFTPPGATGIFIRRIKGCRVAGDTLNGAEGTDANKVEIPLDVMQITDILPSGKEIALL
jgi:hypothetical protein